MNVTQMEVTLPKSKTAAVVVLFLMVAPLVGCGYLDEELLLSDEQFQQGLETEGTISGSGTGSGYARGLGCGGLGIRMRGIKLRGALTASRAAQLVKSPARMTDEEILEQTDIGIIDETAASDDESREAVVEDVAAAYYATKEKRDRAVAEHYRQGVSE